MRCLAVISSTSLALTMLLAPSARAQNAGGASPAPGGGSALSDLAAEDGKAKDIRPQDVITWEAYQANEGADEKVTVQVRMVSKTDWKVYAQNLKFSGPSGFTVDIQPPPSHKFNDPISGHEVDIYDSGEFTLVYNGAPRWTSQTFPVSITYVGCTTTICLFPYTQTLDVLYVPAAAKLAAAVVQPTTAPTLTADAQAAAPAEGDDLDTRLAKLFNASGASFGALLAIVFVGGLLSNLTPCVAPMIPITLRLLARQGSSPYTSASTYGLGIVVTYSLLGLIAGMSKGLFGSLLASTPFNIAFALIMFGLGVTMLGYGDLSKLQMLGTRLGSGKPSLFNTFLMGTGAGLVAAPCTGPVLLALLAYVAKSNAGVGTSIALVGTYSVGFGIPYVVLGGSAAKASNVRVSPAIQIFIKLAFAAIMFALGFYYLRVPLYGAMQSLAGHWKTVFAAGLGLGAVLTAAWVVVPRINASKAASLLAAGVVGFGLFGGWQWATSAAPAATDAAEASVYHTEESAIAAATAAGKPIMIDMWAEWCEACKKMDATTFADAEVKAELAKSWVILRLDFTQSTPASDKLQEKYEVQGLPTLILLPPDGKLAGKQSVYGYTGAAALINKLRQFTKQRAE